MARRDISFSDVERVRKFRHIQQIETDLVSNLYDMQFGCLRDIEIL